MRVIPNTKEIIEKASLYDQKIGAMIPFTLWPRQVAWLEAIHAFRLLIMVKKRQIAGSTLTGFDKLIHCMLLDNYLTLVLSKTGEDAEEHLRKVMECYFSLDDHFRAASPLKSKPSLDKVEFRNGSRFLSLPANKGAGFTPDSTIVDEAPKINLRNSRITLESVLMNIYPGVEKSSGQLILLGTAEGYGLFHNIFEGAMTHVA